jgi:hypothetical protein
MTKNQQYLDYFVDLSYLASKIQSYLLEHHFEVAVSNEKGHFIQAAKRGALRTTTGTRRSVDVIIKGVPDDFEIKVSSGEWGNNLLVSAPLFVIPVVGIAATAARVYSAKKLESKLWSYIKSEVESLRNTMQMSRKTIQNQYDCDYVEGYPGWKSTVGGKLLIEQNNGKERLVFEAPDGEQITIPSSKILKASIVLGKKDLGPNDQLLEITCIDRDGNHIRPVFSLENGVIPEILIQMNR